MVKNKIFSLVLGSTFFLTAQGFADSYSFLCPPPDGLQQQSSIQGYFSQCRTYQADPKTGCIGSQQIRGIVIPYQGSVAGFDYPTASISSVSLVGTPGAHWVLCKYADKNNTSLTVQTMTEHVNVGGSLINPYTSSFNNSYMITFQDDSGLGK